MKKSALSAAFTLIELLVVISIIGILATLIAANLNSARSRARDAERKSDLRNISTALRLYFNDNGAYPATLPWNSKWESPTKTVYMTEVPQDPLSPDQVYMYTPLNDTFTLTACLENSSDKQGKPDTTGSCTSSNTMYQVVVE